jgi:hypothetical protein
MSAASAYDVFSRAGDWRAITLALALAMTLT